MTPQERAEKIYQWILDPATSLDFKDPTDLIAAQISEAEREAKKEERAYWQEFRRLNHFADHSEAYNAAKEQAAMLTRKWADNVFNGHGDLDLVAWIHEHADKIRAMKPEEKK